MSYNSAIFIKRIGVSLLSALLFSCASVGEEIDHTAYAAFQAVRDFNIKTEPIPPQLRDLDNPFGHTEFTGTPYECHALWTEMQNLETAIARNRGRRVGYRRDSANFIGRTGNLRDAGVKSATTFLTPHRGILQQLSGAAAHEQNAQKAQHRAHVRLGYIIGQARALECPNFHISEYYGNER